MPATTSLGEPPTVSGRAEAGLVPGKVRVIDEAIAVRKRGLGSQQAGAWIALVGGTARTDDMIQILTVFAQTGDETCPGLVANRLKQPAGVGHHPFIEISNDADLGGAGRPGAEIAATGNDGGPEGNLIGIGWQGSHNLKLIHKIQRNLFSIKPCILMTFQS